MSVERLRLRISGMLCAITIDEDVGKAGGVFEGAQEVSFTRARVLLEAQWLKDQRNKDLAAHGEPSGQKEKQATNEPNETMKNSILMTEGDENQNGGGTQTPPTETPTNPETPATPDAPATPAEDNANADGKATPAA